MNAMLNLTQQEQDLVVIKTLQELRSSIETHLCEGYIEFPEEIAKHHRVLRATNTILEFFGDYSEPSR